MNESAMKVPVITIDGPSGAGKGTLAAKLASHTGFHLLDSGALYRLTALVVIRSDISQDDSAAIAQAAAQLAIRFDIKDTGVVPILGNENVAAAIREEHIGMVASRVAAMPEVRQALLQRQRDFCQPPGLVADGRDMGTVVFPNACAKFFLTASAEIRAARRVKQLNLAGVESIDQQKILADIRARDEQDRNRTTAPLVPAEEAIEIDTSDLSVDDVFVEMTTILQNKGVL